MPDRICIIFIFGEVEFGGMSTSIVGFKTASADLHRKSPKIFFVCLVVSVAFTAVMLHLSLPESRRMEKKAVVPPVIIHLENIPETRQRVALPAPPKPFVPSGAPLEVNDLVLDDVTIEDTILDNESYPDTPPALFVKSIGAAEEEKELFEYYEVEEVPKRLNNVIPDFPIMAERAGIHTQSAGRCGRVGRFGRGC